MPPRTQFSGDTANPNRMIEEPDAITDQPVLAFFLDYWKAKRARHALPLRESFVPREVRGNLQWVASADVEGDDFRYRVVGTSVTNYFLADGTGKTAREAFADADAGLRDGILWLMHRACELRQPIRVTGPSSRWKSTFYPAYDTLYLPYSSDGETADRVVTVFTFDRDRMYLRPSASMVMA